MKTRREILNFRSLLTEYSDAIVRHHQAVDREQEMKRKFSTNDATRESVDAASVEEMCTWYETVAAFNRLEEAFSTPEILNVENINDVQFKLRGIRR